MTTNSRSHWSQPTSPPRVPAVVRWYPEKNINPMPWPGNEINDDSKQIRDTQETIDKTKYPGRQYKALS